jgi:hypothetical protein
LFAADKDLASQSAPDPVAEFGGVADIPDDKICTLADL